jgi:hypothetical protein
MPRPVSRSHTVLTFELPRIWLTAVRNISAILECISRIGEFCNFEAICGAGPLDPVARLSFCHVGVTVIPIDGCTGHLV